MQLLKEGKEEHSPQTPYKEKSKKPTTKTTTRARERFVKPTVDEVAAHVRAKGYTFDPLSFWNYYESNGWKVGRNTMKSWTSACVTWQRKEGPQTAASVPSEAEKSKEAFIRAQMFAGCALDKFRLFWRILGCKDDAEATRRAGLRKRPGRCSNPPNTPKSNIRCRRFARSYATVATGRSR